MKKYLTIFICLFISSLTFAQDTTQQVAKDHYAVIRHFVEELANENRAVDIILSQQIIVNEPTAELYDYLEVSLEEIRINLLSKDIKDLQYVPFNKMPAKQVRDIDPEGLDTNNIYFIQYRGKQMLALYLDGDKIGSFTLVSKGYNKAHFVFY